MSTENKRKPRRPSRAPAHAASASADILAQILAELRRLRMELKERDAYYESVGMPMRLPSVEP